MASQTLPWPCFHNEVVHELRHARIGDRRIRERALIVEWRSTLGLSHHGHFDTFGVFVCFCCLNRIEFNRIAQLVLGRRLGVQAVMLAPLDPAIREALRIGEIGRASCRERVCNWV